MIYSHEKARWYGKDHQGMFATLTSCENGYIYRLSFSNYALQILLKAIRVCYLTLAPGELLIVYRDFFVLFFQFNRFGEMLLVNLV